MIVAAIAVVACHNNHISYSHVVSLALESPDREEIQLLIIKFYTALNLNVRNNSYCIYSAVTHSSNSSTSNRISTVALEVYCVSVYMPLICSYIYLFRRDHCAVIWTLFTEKTNGLSARQDRARLNVGNAR